MNRNILLVLFFVKSIACSDQRVEFRAARQEDVFNLVSLMNEQGIQDSDKIVVVPRIFREQYFQHAIDKGQVFVAVDQAGQIVAYKKLFQVINVQEKQAVLFNEIRAKDENLDAVDLLPIIGNGTGLKEEVSRNDFVTVDVHSDVVLYNGGDFTHCDYRNKGLNSMLTATAFNSVVSPVVKDVDALSSNSFRNIVLLFGLTKENACDKAGDGLIHGRTSGILKQFKKYVQAVAKESDCRIVDNLGIARYRAFKPSFNPDSQECIPLPDEKSIPGFGYVAKCKLIKK